jgi:hypothetical protein
VEIEVEITDSEDEVDVVMRVTDLERRGLK